MAKMKRNPYGLATPNVTLVRVGKGEHTHIFDGQSHICQSGKNAGSVGGSGVVPQVRPSESAFATCFRCIKLAQMNQNLYGAFVRPQDR